MKLECKEHSKGQGEESGSWSRQFGGHCRIGRRSRIGFNHHEAICQEYETYEG